MCLARLREAVQLHQNGELNQAKKLYRKIVNKDKKNSQAHYLLGLLYQQQVDFSKALKHLKYALLISPADLSFINALEKIYSSQGDILQLQGLIQHCIKYNVENDKIQVKLANLLVKNGQAGIAIGIFESMLDKHRNNWRVWLDFGNCLFFALELERAKQVYQHVLSLKDGQEDALNNLAAIAIEKKQVNEAEGYILRVLSQNHQHVVARYNLANILYERQQRCKAREIVIDLLRDFPDYLEASLLMAKILRCDGDYGSAINIYERLMDKKCVNGILFNDIGNCYFEIGDFNTARIYFSKSLPLPERSNDARFNLATCFLQLKNYDAAIKEFSGLLDIAADYTKAYAPYLHGLRQCCLWNQAEKIESKIKLQLKNRSNINIPPFSMITLESSTSEEQIEIARQWTTRQKRKHPELTGQQVVKLADTPLSGLKLKTADRQRVRLGYFSADFHNQ